jgi:hypothetical protein
MSDRALLEELVDFIQSSYQNGTDIFDEMDRIVGKEREIRTHMAAYDEMVRPKPSDLDDYEEKKDGN